MVRLVVLFIFVTTFLQATILEDKIESFIGEKVYKTQKNLIRILFKDESSFLKVDSSVDDIKVLQKLKDNGILKLFYKDPQELNLSFITKNNSLVFMRVINEALSSMGYNYFLTKRALKNSDKFLWEIIISTEHIVDPLIFSDRLIARGCYIENVDRSSQNDWAYKINSDNIRIESKRVEANKTVKLKKPIKPYWIDVKDMKSISFVSKIADKWHPSIVFYNDKLHIVKDFQKDKVTNRLKIKVPSEAQYVKVSDIYTLDNIKRGISIYLRKR